MPWRIGNIVFGTCKDERSERKDLFVHFGRCRLAAHVGPREKATPASERFIARVARVAGEQRVAQDAVAIIHPCPDCEIARLNEERRVLSVYRRSAQ